MQRSMVTHVAQQSRMIGGMFGIEPDSPAADRPPLLRAEDLLLTNARSALWLLLGHLRPGNVWLPAFICPEVIRAVQGTAPIQFFDRGEVDWADRVKSNDVVVILDEFGFPFASRDTLRTLQRQGVIVVEDACQALLTSGVGDEADYVVFSPRKFVGVIDGGILRACSGRTLPAVAWESSASASAAIYQKAAELRAVFDGDVHDGRENGQEWFELFQQAEAAQSCGAFAMTDLSKRILSQVDWSSIIRRRRENYRTLLDDLSRFALYPQLPPEVVPLGFPIVLPHRDEVRQKLFAERIYPPVHWHLAGHVPPEFLKAHELSARIMTLPCDQRYDTADMQRMAAIILREER